MKNHKSISRREFLNWFAAATGASVGWDPISTIISAVTSKYVSTAFAEEIVKQEVLRYVFIQNYGAPPRQHFDLFLNPNNESIVFNQQMSNAYSVSSGKYTEGRYTAILKNGYYVPPLWGQKTSATGRDISELLGSMLTIQGIYGLNASHPFNAAIQTQPIPGGLSIGGLVADHTSNPISAVAVGSSLAAYSYKSFKNKSLLQTSLGGVNQAHSLFEPFKRNVAGNFSSQIDAVEEQVDSAIHQLNLINKKYSRVLVDHMSAKKLLKTAIGQYFDSWNPIYLKYTNLVKSALSLDANFKGYADRPIGIPTADRDNRYSVATGKNSTIDDLRSGINPAVTTISFLAENFATAEFLLLNDYTRSFRMGTGSTLNNVDLAGRLTVPNDQHFIGYMPGILVNALHYRAYAACLLELIDQLKQKIDSTTGQSYFHDTLIHFAGEFNRMPSYISHPNQLMGTSHGFRGSSASFFSGRFQNLQIVGDTLKSDKAGTRDVGSWGHAAKIADLNNEYLTHSHLANSIAFMLNVPPLVTNATSIIRKSGENYVAAISRSKLVDNT